jgi:peptidoglycan/LPS O-acetylase OafA/YrhL
VSHWRNRPPLESGACPDSAKTMTATPATEVPGTKRASGRRLRELDSLRGIAAVCVLLFHLSTTANDHYHQWPIQVPWGHFGVELFFVISGFVILMTLEKSAGVTEFLISRVTRLYPAYWCAVLLTSALLAVELSPAAPSFSALMADLTMLQSFLRVRSIDPSYWTLTAELIFYVAIVAWYRFRSTRLPDIEWYALGWIGAAAVLRTVLLLHHHATLPGPISMPLLLYYGQFFIVGICLYRLYCGHNTRVTLFTLLAACALSAFGGGPITLYAAPVPYFLLTCGIAAVVFLASRSRLPLLRNPVLLFFGDISYPLYLIHQVIGTELMSMSHEHGWPAWVSLPGILLALVTVAYLIHVAVEVPARTTLRTRLQKWALLQPRAPSRVM